MVGGRGNGERYDAHTRVAIDARIEQARAALAEAPSREARITILRGLEHNLGLRQRARRRPADLDELIEANRSLVALIAPGSAPRAESHLRLATLLSWRDGNDGHDLTEAIASCEAATGVGGEVAFRARAAHGQILRNRFKHRWDRAALAEAVAHAEHLCLDMAKAARLRGADLATSGRQLVDILDQTVPERAWVRGSFTGWTADGTSFRFPQWILKDAISLYASLLRYRYRFMFDEQDLHDAIRSDRIGLRLISPNSQSHWAWLVTSIAQSTNYLARDGGADDELDRAIADLRLVLPTGTPTASIDRGRRSTLAGLLHLKAMRTHEVADVTEAIELHQASLDHGTGQNPVYATWQLQDLAGCFLLRHQLSPQANQQDLQFAHQAIKQAWKKRNGEVTVGLLDTAMVFADVLRRVDPHGLALHSVLGRACTVLSRLERRRSFGERDVLQSLGGRYAPLRDWSVEWHALRTLSGITAGDDAAVARRVARTHKAIEGAKQRTLVAHMDVQDMRPDEALSAPFDEYRRIAESLPMTGADRNDQDTDAAAEQYSSPDPRRNSIDEHRAAEVQSIEALERRLDQIAAQVADADADLAAAVGLIEPLPIDEVARALPRGTQMVVFYPLDKATVVIGIERHGTPDRAGVARLAMAPIARKTLDKWASAMFQDIWNKPVGRPEGQRVAAVLQVIAQGLLPAMAKVVSGWAQATSGPDRENVPGLVLVPTGSLHRIPLHALPLEPQAGASGDGLRLIDRFAVSYVTTADVLPRVVRRPAAPNGIVAVAPGAREADGRAPGANRGATPHATVAFVEGLAALGQAHSPPPIRHDATRKVVTDGQLEGNRFVFVAAHGRAGRPGLTSRSGRALSTDGTTDLGDADKEVQAGILMHGGVPGSDLGRWLSVRRIVARARMAHVEHLQLLACDTHADDPAPGDELSGLLSAFLVRGGRSVGGTLWEVDEVSAIVVGWWMAEQLLAGVTNKAAALRVVMRRLRRATFGEVVAALTAIRDAAARSPWGCDQKALDALTAFIDHFRQLPTDAVTDLWELHHWSPYVLHGAPQVWGGGADRVGPEFSGARTS